MLKQVPKKTKSNPVGKYLNKEISWLHFNKRVLNIALKPDTPLLERLKFLGIFTTNLDEFFMVRLAGLKKMLKEGYLYCESPDRGKIRNVLFEINIEVRRDVATRDHYLKHVLLPELKEHSIEIVSYKSLSAQKKSELNRFFKREVFPLLTPLGVDPAHPYPILSNLKLYLMVEFYNQIMLDDTPTSVGFVEIPSVVPRFIPVSSPKNQDSCIFLLLEELIEVHLGELFYGQRVASCKLIRVTRNLDYHLLESHVIDLLESIKQEVINREHQEAVRIEISSPPSQSSFEQLKETLHVENDDIFLTSGPILFPDIGSLYKTLAMPHLKFPEFSPILPNRIGDAPNLFDLIKEKDLLVHHPFESFSVVNEFLHQSAKDPQVLSIKQTLYRSSGDSNIIESLIKAARNGKSVTVIVELKARFDEKNNIEWAQQLERAGVNVVFGFVGLKTHCKMILISRRENDRITRYLHLATGNYNSDTAKIYTDLGLFTINDLLVEDSTKLFNLLTGFNIFDRKRRPLFVNPIFKALAVAPINLKETLLNAIEKITNGAIKGKPSLIFVKLNHLTDKNIIDKLYLASQNGVKVRLIVRGMCSLKPRVARFSQNIEVISIIDRFLEHSRIYFFETDGFEKLYVGSADWMPRNLERRIETAFPIMDGEIRQRIKTLLDIYWQDNTSAYSLTSHGNYKKMNSTLPPWNAQEKLMTMAMKNLEN